MSARKLKLDINLSVLDDLGLRLYSSSPAVLSEIVANSWDADAETVKITINEAEQKITIDDDGEGMTFDEALTRFLKVGYRRRENQPVITPKHNRRVMGRKGIGKLAPLAIAEEVEVETRKGGQILAFILKVDKIRDDIRHGRIHEPKIVKDTTTTRKDGTTITLRRLKKQVQWTEKPLRKRLALRFGILGPTYSFSVEINGSDLSAKDIDFYAKIELAWAYQLPGDDPERSKLAPSAEWEDREATVQGAAEGYSQEYSFKGWLATTRFPSDLEDNGHSFARVVIFVRGKVAYENATALVNDDHIFTKYLVGEVHADFLDDDDKDDIATSSRQGLIESDPRVEVLRDFLAREFKYINKRWSERRAEKGGIAVYDIPAVKQYLDSLQPDPRKKAQRFLGKIWSSRDLIDNTAELLKSGILFCENLRVQESLDKLDLLDLPDLKVIHEAFELVTVMEATQYHRIIQARLKVIEAFQKIVNRDEKEKVLQAHIADHLWLLNPSWDVVPTIGAKQVEKSLSSLAEHLKGTGSAKEKKGRLDIFYSRTSTTHVIIELKRYTATPSGGDLVEQVGRYRREVRAILDKAGRTAETIEVYLLLGEHPGNTPETRETLNRQLAIDNAQIVLYDELIDRAQELHRGYLEVQAHMQQLSVILDSVDEDAEDAFSK